jgi:hypothetical protein
MGGALLLAALNLWYAWSYHDSEIGPDEALWLLWPVTGSRPFVDFVGGMIGTHLWIKGLSLLVGKSIKRLKFAHHAAMGLFPIAGYLLTGSLAVGIMMTAVLQSGLLLAFQSWIDALSGGLLAVALLAPSPWNVVLLGLAVITNVKMIPAGLVIIVWHGLWAEFAIGLGAAGVIATLWWGFFHHSFMGAWYEMVTVSLRVPPHRKKCDYKELWFNAPAMVALVLAAAYMGKPVALPWLVFLAYTATNSAGGYWRSNHFLPIVVLAAADPPLEWALAVLAVDWAMMRFYLGNPWRHGYLLGTLPVWQQVAKVARHVATLNGSLFVNDMATQLYPLSGKRCKWGRVEELELRHITPEREWVRDRLLREQPPDIVVNGPDLAVNPDVFRRYRPVYNEGGYSIWIR